MVMAVVVVEAGVVEELMVTEIYLVMMVMTEV